MDKPRFSSSPGHTTRLGVKVLSLLTLFLMLAALVGPTGAPVLAVQVGGASGVTVTPAGNTNCQGVVPTPGSANTQKFLIAGNLEPGGTATFMYTYPVDLTSNNADKTWQIEDCVLINGVTNPAAYHVFISFVPNSNPFVFDVTFDIPAGTQGQQFCNVAKTTQSPSAPQGSNRKADSCFVIGGNLSIQKVNAAGAPLSGALFDVSCTAPTTSAALPALFIASQVFYPVTSAQTYTVTGVSTGSDGRILVQGPAGTVCTFTETQAPPGYLLPANPVTTATTTADGTADNIQIVDPTASGSLTVTKTVTGGSFSGSFPVSVDCGTGTPYTDTIAYPTPGQVTFTGIPAGSTCTVTEGTLPAAPSGYSWGTPSYTNNGATVAAGGSATIGITNSLTANPGSLTVTKTVTGGSFSGSFPVSVDCGTGTPYTDTIAYPTPGQVTFTGIPAGSTCTVTEGTLPAAPSGYSWGTPSYTNNGATVAAGGSATIGITNSLTANPGSLTVTKTVTGGSFSGSFPVSVDCGTGTPYTDTIAYPTPGQVTFTGIPAGSTCTVTEGTLPAAPSGYSWGTPSYTNNGATVAAGGSATIGITNSLTANPGSLTVTKTVTGGSFSGSFPVSVDCGTGTPYTDTIAYPTPGQVTFTGIPAGFRLHGHRGHPPGGPERLQLGHPELHQQRRHRRRGWQRHDDRHHQLAGNDTAAHPEHQQAGERLVERHHHRRTEQRTDLHDPSQEHGERRHFCALRAE